MEKKNSTVKVAVIVAAVVCIIGAAWYLSVCSHLVSLSEKVEQQRSYVAAAYQERADLIPNLVSTVKAAADYESDTLNNVTEARTGLSNAVKSGDTKEMQEADDALTKTINVMVEAYPEITATQNFVSLQDQLEGSENRIRVARNYYSDAIKDYNSYIKKPLISGIAKQQGYRAEKYFAVSAEAETAPTVSFE